MTQREIIRNKENQKLYLGILSTLVKAIEAKSHYTKEHSDRVTKYALLTGRKLGLSKEQLNNLKYACELHDIGKI
ncbi:MAG: phosphohydrolase, partial [Candidatus Omnitrophica bacterium]|nr:phosphohydrolase [Candidatus Omnitrophota bacterium]